MENPTVRRFAIRVAIGLLCAFTAGPASAQLAKQDQLCITTFNKGIRQVAKVQSQIIRKCLTDFAAGRLSTATPEVCVRSDPRGKLEAAIEKAAAKTADKCATVTPPFGVTQVDAAFVRTVLAQLDLVHGTVGADLDTNLIGNQSDALCQTRIAAAQFKCKDRRLREFLKCQKSALRAGTATDAASLTAACLGTGGDPQPDPKGVIDRDCRQKLGAELLQRCGDTDLQAAFAPCDTTDPTTAAACLKNESACQLCLLLNDVDGLARDCDLLDDGDTNNGSCGKVCADGVVQTGELCDDGDSDGGDGCSASCAVEGGWTCSGSPSVCTQLCGNGELDAGELCDDGDAQGGDGCSSACEVEAGYSCTGEPSVCTPSCGNGDLETENGEVCDDGDAQSGDGCSSTCQVEGGYNCAGEPSVCTFVCGNGTFESGETCDDGDALGNDGCSGTCQIETGWLCVGQPSVCTPKCGDGLKRGGETCDDGNTLSGDGCSFLCNTEPGYQCPGTPSNCIAICGDGFIRGLETCDDSNTTSGDGCSGTLCRLELNFTCAGQPSVCAFNCGDGNLDGSELCDDGNNANGDGCSAACLTESGYSCAGQPSLCVPTCGNGVLEGSEQCDDGNVFSRDGCNASCRIERGWLCPTPGQLCNQFELFITSPANGTFTTASSIVVSGNYTLLPAGQAAVTINGVPATTLNQVNRTFSHTVALSATAIFNPIRVTLTNTATGDTIHERIVVIRGDSVADGAFSPQSVAMRINDSGLDVMEGLVSELAAGQLDLATILPPGTVMTSGCFIEVIGCLGSATVKVSSPPPSFSSFSLGINSIPNAVFGDIRINNLRVDVEIDGSGLVPDCTLRLTANQLQLSGNYALSPDPGNASNIDVNLVTNPLNVSFAGFNHTFTSGLCDAPVIGDIIGALLPDIEAQTRDGIQGFLSDPDGAGAQDSPIADAIEDVLAGISITGPVGEGLGLMFESPLFAVTEDNAGITLGSNSRFQMSFGNGPGQCIPPPGAPNLTASYSKNEAFPAFSGTAPVSGAPYGLGIAISSSGFNQLLRGQTECGLMRSSLTTLDLDGAGGNPPLPINSSLLSFIVPEFAQLPANTPLRIDIAPTLAPIVTGNAGPTGELTELKIAQVRISIVEPGAEIVWLGGVLDARLGMSLSFLPDGSGLAISLTPPAVTDLTVAIVDNPLGASEVQVETILPALVQPLIPDLAGALSGFPLPQFFGFQLQGVEVSKQGQFLSLFANLAPVP